MGILHSISQNELKVEHRRRLISLVKRGNMQFLLAEKTEGKDRASELDEVGFLTPFYGLEPALAGWLRVL